MAYDFEDIYLAYRQAKTALYYEKRGVGLLSLAQFEDSLAENLRSVLEAANRGSWFDDIPAGRCWIVPKKVDAEPIASDYIRIGSLTNSTSPVLDVQLRLSPSPEFAVMEVLYLWRFGCFFEALLSTSAIGYRLDLRNAEVQPTRRWLFEYWPDRYNEFRTVPLKAARKLLKSGGKAVILTADLASFYDNVDPTFLMSDFFVGELRSLEGFDDVAYLKATKSLLDSYQNYLIDCSKLVGRKLQSGIPIGSLISRVIANLALSTLDEYVERTEEVVCYRRYVDDIVLVAREAAASSASELLRQFFPVSSIDSGQVVELDSELLRRVGSTFQLKSTKTKAHSLTGDQGIDFVEAVLGDFAKHVSRSRSFLDPSVLVSNSLKFLTVGGSPNAPLRVLREADRVRLEHLGLASSLRTLRRVSALVDATEASSLVRRVFGRVARTIDSDEHWVASLELTLQILQVAVHTQDWQTAAEICAQMDSAFGSVDLLSASVSTLRYCGELIPSGRVSTWRRLRDYLHERRLESIASALPSLPLRAEFQKWLPEGFKFKNSWLKIRALTNRARLLSRADLRSADREDDSWEAVFEEAESNWLREQFPGSSPLGKRFRSIDVFIERCRDLGDKSWLIPATRMFLSTKPPSYFDVARRLLYRVEKIGFSDQLFLELLEVVNAIRGTRYSDAVGSMVGDSTVKLGWSEESGHLQEDPLLILGNLCGQADWWRGAASRKEDSRYGEAVLTIGRLAGLTSLLEAADRAANMARVNGGSSLLVLPELSVPRVWFRAVANHIVRRGRYSAIIGLEYLHDRSQPYVYNQAFAVVPGPFHSVATWPWTKRLPARGERLNLKSVEPPVSFRPPTEFRPRTVIVTPWGRFSVLICSELIEAKRVVDLVGRVELVLVPAWNKDTASYDHLIRSVGLNLHSIVAVANIGQYSDCRAWGPRYERYERDLCRLIERGVDTVVQVRLPIQDLLRFRRAEEVARSPFAERATPHTKAKKPKWKALPPEWPVN